jgi:hypothetical protein
MELYYGYTYVISVKSLYREEVNTICGKSLSG